MMPTLDWFVQALPIFLPTMGLVYLLSAYITHRRQTH